MQRDTGSMQLGWVFSHMLKHIYDAVPAHKPVHMLKVDLSDILYHVWMIETDIPKLVVSLSCEPGDDHLRYNHHQLQRQKAARELCGQGLRTNSVSWKTWRW